MSHQSLGTWLASDPSSLPRVWECLDAVDLVVVQRVCQHVQQHATKLLQSVSRHLVGRKFKIDCRRSKFHRGGGSPAGDNCWADVTTFFVFALPKHVQATPSTPNPDPEAAVTNIPKTVAGDGLIPTSGSQPSRLAGPEPPPPGTGRGLAWKVEIFEHEITSDTEDSDYDEYINQAAWDHSYGGIQTFTRLRGLGQSTDPVSPVDSFAPMPASGVKFIGSTFVLPCDPTLVKRKGVFRRKAAPLPVQAHARLLLNRHSRQVGLRIRLPFAAGWCKHKNV